MISQNKELEEQLKLVQNKNSELELNNSNYKNEIENLRKVLVVKNFQLEKYNSSNLQNMKNLESKSDKFKTPIHFKSKSNQKNMILLSEDYENDSEEESLKNSTLKKSVK